MNDTCSGDIYCRCSGIGPRARACVDGWCFGVACLSLRNAEGVEYLDCSHSEGLLSLVPSYTSPSVTCAEISARPQGVQNGPKPTVTGCCCTEWCDPNKTKIIPPTTAGVAVSSVGGAASSVGGAASSVGVAAGVAVSSVGVTVTPVATPQLYNSMSGAMGTDDHVGLIVGLTIPATLLIFVILVAWLVRRSRRQLSRRHEGMSSSMGGLSSGGMSSGRQDRLHMVPRSLVDHIEIDKDILLGAGGYGTVYRGMWSDREVAVKHFSDERAFRWEHDLLSCFNMNHRNIVEFYGADIIHDETALTQYWLVTEYHPLRSLQRYLQHDAFGLQPVPVKPEDEAETSKEPTGGFFSLKSRSGFFSWASGLSEGRSQAASNSADANAAQGQAAQGNEAAPFLDPTYKQQIFNMVESLVCGLEHLHALFGRTGFKRFTGFRSKRDVKPVVAHCDLKSANVLVRNDLTCCITDFGQSVYLDPETEIVRRPVHLLNQRGTHRYLSPENLDGSADGSNIMSYLQQDTYALGLVIWEIVNCCPCGANPRPGYNVPYHQDLNRGNPSVEDVKNVVCDQDKRPLLQPHWAQSKSFSLLVSMMRSCWDKNPADRPLTSSLAKYVTKLRIEATARADDTPTPADSQPPPVALYGRTSLVEAMASNRDSAYESGARLPVDIAQYEADLVSFNSEGCSDPHSTSSSYGSPGTSPGKLATITSTTAATGAGGDIDVTPTPSSGRSCGRAQHRSRGAETSPTRARTHFTVPPARLSIPLTVLKEMHSLPPQSLHEETPSELQATGAGNGRPRQSARRLLHAPSSRRVQATSVELMESAV